MDTPRVILLVILIFFLFVTPDTQPATADQRHELDTAVERELSAVRALNASGYGDLAPQSGQWINVTGLSEEVGLAWELLQPVKEEALGHLRGLTGSVGLEKLNGHQHNGPSNRTAVESGDPAASTGPKKGIPLYRNVTGLIRGEWVRSEISKNRPAPSLNLTLLAPNVGYIAQDFTRNITGVSGDIQIRLSEKASDVLADGESTVREVSASVAIKDETSPVDGWTATVHGVHYPDFGGIIMTTTSEKFAGLFALPHFALSERSFILAQRLLGKTMTEVVSAQRDATTAVSTNPWTSSPGSATAAASPVPHCEYLVYLQQHPTTVQNYGNSQMSSPWSANSDAMEAIEQELRFPSGAPVPSAPQLTMSMVLFSPDCGFVLESKGPPRYTPQEGLHLHGPKVESYLRVGKNYALIYGLISGSQMLLLIRQMARASTPSTVSRVSLYTIGMMALGDGFASMAFLTFGMFADAAFLMLITTAFLSFIGVSFFGMKFLMEIWTVQAPERARRASEMSNANAAREATRNAAAQAPVRAAADADTLPAPATALPLNNSGATPVILPPDQDLAAAEAEDAAMVAAPDTTGTGGTTRREIGALYSRFYILLMMIIFVSLHATSWPAWLRSAYTNTLAFLYLSFWTPQIYRNVMRNTRKPLAWEFIFGQSILRSLPFLYFFTVSDNILFIKTDHTTALVLAGWVWTQLLLLLGQDVAGPRCFTPAGWAPPAYDYHPVLRDDDVESGALMALASTETSRGDGHQTGTASSTANDSKGSTRSFDCAICTEHVEVSVVPPGRDNGASSQAGLAESLSRRSYMVTPCHHIYHSRCLEGWLRYRLQCPVCRSPCPPI